VHIHTTSLVLVVGGCAAVGMAATWWLQKRTRNAGYVDVAWAGLLAVAALIYGSFAEGAGVPRLLVAMLGGIWGVRLALHLLSRVLHEAEDGRYAALREHWDGHQGKFFGFFMFQAGLVVLFSLPFLAVAVNPHTGFGWIELVGILVWVGSLAGESIADMQLSKFRSCPGNRGKVCRRGLWNWSRHPNYFFEWLHWFAYVLLAWGSPLWWLSWLGPVAMLVSLLWVTGIPYTEKQALRSRGEAYRKYQREVSMFVPLPPRESNS
jgi:steroid 5-alpha reductase family enzyme